MRPSPGEPGAVDGVGLPLFDRRQQPDVLSGVVFQIGVLDDRRIARGLRNAGPDRRTLPLVLLLEHELVDLTLLQ